MISAMLMSVTEMHFTLSYDYLIRKIRDALCGTTILMNSTLWPSLYEIFFTTENEINQDDHRKFRSQIPGMIGIPRSWGMIIY